MSERVLCVGSDLRRTPGIEAIGRELAGPGGKVATLVAPSEAGSAKPSSVDQIFIAGPPELDVGRGDHVGAAIASAVRAFEATIVLTSPGKVNREAIARAAVEVLGSVSTGIRAPRVTSEGVEVSRDLLSGNATGVERLTGRPLLLALADETIGDPSQPPGNLPTESVPISVELPPYSFRRVSMEPKPPREINLEAAERVVAVGRGLRRKEDLVLIEDLARVLGAAVGCTRPIAAESGWLTDDHWIGLTGHRVRPSLYLAIGISGAAQHLVGMRDSKVVVAINQDANAPIFAQADVQVVGDLYAIVPELTRRLREVATASSTS